MEVVVTAQLANPAQRPRFGQQLLSPWTERKKLNPSSPWTQGHQPSPLSRSTAEKGLRRNSLSESNLFDRSDSTRMNDVTEYDNTSVLLRQMRSRTSRRKSKRKHKGGKEVLLLTKPPGGKEKTHSQQHEHEGTGTYADERVPHPQHSQKKSETITTDAEAGIYEDAVSKDLSPENSGTISTDEELRIYEDAASKELRPENSGTTATDEELWIYEDASSKELRPENNGTIATDEDLLIYEDAASKGKTPETLKARCGDSHEPQRNAQPHDTHAAHCKDKSAKSHLERMTTGCADKTPKSHPERMTTGCADKTLGRNHPANKASSPVKTANNANPTKDDEKSIATALSAPKDRFEIPVKKDIGVYIDMTKDVGKHLSPGKQRRNSRTVIRRPRRRSRKLGASTKVRVRPVVLKKLKSFSMNDDASSATTEAHLYANLISDGKRFRSPPKEKRIPGLESEEGSSLNEEDPKEKTLSSKPEGAVCASEATSPQTNLMMSPKKVRKHRDGSVGMKPLRHGDGRENVADADDPMHYQKNSMGDFHSDNEEDEHHPHKHHHRHQHHYQSRHHHRHQDNHDHPQGSLHHRHHDNHRHQDSHQHQNHHHGSDQHQNDHQDSHIYQNHSHYQNHHHHQDRHPIHIQAQDNQHHQHHTDNHTHHHQENHTPEDSQQNHQNHHDQSYHPHRHQDLYKDHLHHKDHPHHPHHHHHSNNTNHHKEHNHHHHHHRHHNQQKQHDEHPSPATMPETRQQCSQQPDSVSAAEEALLYENFQPQKCSSPELTPSGSSEEVLYENVEPQKIVSHVPSGHVDTVENPSKGAHQTHPNLEHSTSHVPEMAEEPKSILPPADVIFPELHRTISHEGAGFSHCHSPGAFPVPNLAQTSKEHAMSGGQHSHNAGADLSLHFKHLVLQNDNGDSIDPADEEVGKILDEMDFSDSDSDHGFDDRYCTEAALDQDLRRTDSLEEVEQILHSTRSQYSDLEHVWRKMHCKRADSAKDMDATPSEYAGMAHVLRRVESADTEVEHLYELSPFGSDSCLSHGSAQARRMTAVSCPPVSHSVNSLSTLAESSSQQHHPSHTRSRSVAQHPVARDPPAAHQHTTPNEKATPAVVGNRYTKRTVKILNPRKWRLSSAFKKWGSLKNMQSESTVITENWDSVENRWELLKREKLECAILNGHLDTVRHSLDLSTCDKLETLSLKDGVGHTVEDRLDMSQKEQLRRALLHDDWESLEHRLELLKKERLESKLQNGNLDNVANRWNLLMKESPDKAQVNGSRYTKLKSALKNGHSLFRQLRVNQDDLEGEMTLRIQEEEEETQRQLLQQTTSSPSTSNKTHLRSNVVNEIITAETEYVKHLRDVIEGYLKQARKRPEMFPVEKVTVIFSNIEEIYNFAVKLLGHLQSAVNKDQPHLTEFGQCFLSKTQEFEIYSEYCNNHPAACEELREMYRVKRFRHFFEACRLLQEMSEIPLEGFLLTPVQKICKYHLQLGELLKYTPTDHPDYGHVQSAVEAMKKIAKLVNERKRKMESIETLAEWQMLVDDWEGPDILDDSSELIYSGELNKINANGWSQERYFFLFDHQLVYCKKDLLKKNSFGFKGRIHMDQSIVVSVPDGRDAQYNVNVRNGLKIHDQERNKWFLMVAKTAQIKQRWLKAFSDERRRVHEDMENNFNIPFHLKQAIVSSLKLKSTSTKSKGKRKAARGNAHRSSKSNAWVSTNATLPRESRPSTLAVPPGSPSLPQQSNRIMNFFLLGGKKK